MWSTCALGTSLWDIRFCSLLSRKSTKNFHPGCDWDCLFCTVWCFWIVMQNLHCFFLVQLICSSGTKLLSSCVLRPAVLLACSLATQSSLKGIHLPQKPVNGYLGPVHSIQASSFEVFDARHLHHTFQHAWSDQIWPHDRSEVLEERPK